MIALIVRKCLAEGARLLYLPSAFVLNLSRCIRARLNFLFVLIFGREAQPMHISG
jgi:hypothetical protein